METFSVLLAFCMGNSLVSGELPSQKPVTRSFDVFFDLRLNKLLSEQLRRLWFETPLRLLWRHCKVFSGYKPEYSRVHTPIWWMRSAAAASKHSSEIDAKHVSAIPTALQARMSWLESLLKIGNNAWNRVVNCLLHGHVRRFKIQDFINRFLSHKRSLNCSNLIDIHGRGRARIYISSLCNKWY